MTTLLWDPFSGIAGNMAVASLVDLGVDPECLHSALHAIPFPEGRLELILERRIKNGISSMYFNTVDDEPHTHAKHHEHSHGHPHGSHEMHEHHADSSSHHHDHDHPDRHDHHHDHPLEHSHEHVHSHDFRQKSDHNNEQKGSEIKPNDHALPHRGFAEIRELIEKTPVTPAAKERALAIFRALGEAEACVHGATLETIHFHEVGARDSIADIIGTAVCLDELGVTSIFTSPIHLGTGFTICQHGTFPVPPPAVALLLEGYPVFTLPGIRGELTTPTGAAILRGLGARPGMPPDFCYDRVGYGAGTRDFGVPNVLRAFFARGNQRGRILEGVSILETNLDNATGELLAHAAEQLLAAGALDVSLTPVQMKKGRPGTMLTAIVRPENADAIEEQIYRELPTLGVRRRLEQRTVLAREPAVVSLPFGDLAAKRIQEIDGTVRTSIEFEARRKAATGANIPLRRIPDNG
ncbi:MAG: nickel pincer cofactor biosynthesis protein LarC [Candidatus Riflebacteria bacterium]|nr:nickel pincer cofactor biosynthesis protein LarC [Candidatus Riflebacteria bacterium]